NPDSAWSARLAGGVSAVVPIALWAEVPEGDSARRQGVQQTTPREPASPNDRATRIAGVIGAWNVFQHSYPYFDIVKVDWNAELSRALRTAASDSSPAEYLATLRRLVAALQDGHGNVYAMAATTRRGFLPIALDWVENRLVVTGTGREAPPEIN